MQAVVVSDCPSFSLKPLNSLGTIVSDGDNLETAIRNDYTRKFECGDRSGSHSFKAAAFDPVNSSMLCSNDFFRSANGFAVLVRAWLMSSTNC